MSPRIFLHGYCVTTLIICTQSSSFLPAPRLNKCHSYEARPQVKATLSFPCNRPPDPGPLFCPSSSLCSQIHVTGCLLSQSSFHLPPSLFPTPRSALGGLKFPERRQAQTGAEGIPQYPAFLPSLRFLKFFFGNGDTQKILFHDGHGHPLNEWTLCLGGF